MGYSPEALFRLFLEAFLLGLILGVLRMLFQSPRILFLEDPARLALPEKAKALLCRVEGDSVRLKRHLYGERTLIFFEDLLLLLLAACGMLLLLFVGNEGRFRWFVPLGMLLGFWLFRGTLEKLFSRLIRCAVSALRLVFSCLWHPFRLLARSATRLLQNGQEMRKQRRMLRRERRLQRKNNEEASDLAEYGGVPFSEDD